MSNLFVSVAGVCVARMSRNGFAGLVALTLLAGAPQGHAQPVEAAAPADAAPGIAPTLEQQVRDLAMAGSRNGLAGVSRFEVSVGQLDPRLQLAPCEQIEPYLPNGTRLWGKSRIGLRCVRGASPWNVYLPITVKAWGPGLVATGMLPAGATITAGDLAQAEVDLAEERDEALADTGIAVGRTLARQLKPGQSLRRTHLKARQWFAAGEMVQVMARGRGFSVASMAEAMSNGIEGQAARVRTEGGRILTGMPVGEHRMELNL